MTIRNLLGVTGLAFLLSGCALLNGKDKTSSQEIIETILAPASEMHPRHSEGDILVLKDETLLAAWSDFTGGPDDHATANISAAKSKDGGRTWGEPFLLQENVGRNNVMSVSLLRTRSGDILFFFLIKNSNTDLKLVVRRSTDDARSWGAPVVITREPGYHIMNNARAIQLKSGRILCPISSSADIGTGKEPLRNFIYYSDDNGRTWQQSEDTIECPKRGAMEPGLVELKDGTLLQIIRTQMGQIWFSLSADRGNKWTQPGPFGVVSPESPSTIGRMPGRGELILIYNPNIKARTPLVAALSRDEGKTWSAPKTIEASAEATYAYTSLTFQRDRALLTYYVAPNGTNRLSLKFKSIPLGWFRSE
ncbi:MAG: sialidase family protein [Verrucomicrobiota bacterium]